MSYDTICTVLGVKFDLVQSGAGLVEVVNTNERVLELCEALGDVLRNDRLGKTEGEKLRGRLLFASEQLFGRVVRNQSRILSSNIKSGRSQVSNKTNEALIRIEKH